MNELNKERITAVLRVRPVLFAREDPRAEAKERHIVLIEEIKPVERQRVDTDNDCACG